MKIEILDDNLERRIYDVNKLECNAGELQFIDSSSKELSILEILRVYINTQKAVLFDSSNHSIKTFIDNMMIENINSIDFDFLLFTSGTTGKPIGAFKTRENLDNELLVHMNMLKKYAPKKVISTVPFIHIYGLLTAVLLPYRMGLDVFFKEHFLPHDLLEAIEPHSIVVTTPLYIKSLIRLNEVKSFKDVVFISSTGPLEQSVAKEFIKKFDTNLIQLFGSTETGGIAYKKQYDPLWTPMDQVSVGCNEKGLLHVRSPFVSQSLYEDGIKKTEGMVQSFDYVEFEEDNFKIVGRDSQIFKVGGKRYSTLHVEEILEKLENVKKAFVTIKYNKDDLKDEVLHVFLEKSDEISHRVIKEELHKNFGKIKFPIKIMVVEKIPTTALGKKIMPI